MPIAIDDSLPVIDPKDVIAYCARQGLPTDTFVGKANKYMTSCGPKPGRGWFLVTRQVLDLIDLNDYHSVTFINPAPGIPVQQRANNLTVLPDPISITPGYEGDPAEIFLIQFADLRWLPQNPYYACPINKQYNMIARDAQYGELDSGIQFYTDTAHSVSDPYTWQQVLDSIWEDMSLDDMGDSPVLPYADTDLASGSSASDTSITVSDATNIEVGDFVTIGIDTENVETVQVMAVDPVTGILTITATLHNHDVSEVVTGPSGCPINYSFVGVSAWDAYNGILERLSCALVQKLNISDEETKVFAIVRLGWRDDDDYALFQTALDRAAPYIDYTSRPPNTLIASIIPGNVQVYFHKYLINYGNEDTTDFSTGQWITQNAYTHTVTAATILVADIADQTIATTFATIWDESPALVDEALAVTNSNELDIRAKDRANLIYRRLNAGTSMYNAYIGIFNDSIVEAALVLAGGQAVALFKLSRFVTGLAFYDYGLPHKGGVGKMMTDVVRSSGMIAPYDGKWEDIPAIETLKAPDFGRNTFPNYPDTVQIIQCGDETSEDGVFEGTVVHVNPADESILTSEPCYLWGANAMTLTTDTLYEGRLSGQKRIDDESRAFYVIASGGGGGSDTTSVGFVLPFQYIGSVTVANFWIGTLNNIDPNSGVLSVKTPPASQGGYNILIMQKQKALEAGQASLIVGNVYIAKKAGTGTYQGRSVPVYVVATLGAGGGSFTPTGYTGPQQVVGDEACTGGSLSVVKITNSYVKGALQ